MNMFGIILIISKIGSEQEMVGLYKRVDSLMRPRLAIIQLFFRYPITKDTFMLGNQCIALNKEIYQEND